MNQYILLLLFCAINDISAASLTAKFFPACFTTRPHCIRPRVEECRDAVFLMRLADPGYPIILGRRDIVESHTRAFEVPRRWLSLPYNCVVKLDVIDPKATDELRLQSLTSPAEKIIRSCIIGSTQCGGSMLVGPKRELELTLGYYSAVEMVTEMLAWASNITLQRPIIVPFNNNRNLTTSSIDSS